jgi:hypothetical protein
MQDTFDLIGRVVFVKKSQYSRNRDVNQFKVRPHSDDGKDPINIQVLCSYFCPVDVGDIFFGHCELKKGVAIVLKPPFVRITLIEKAS